jgi:hypothetical protein
VRREDAVGKGGCVGEISIAPRDPTVIAAEELDEGERAVG